MAYTNSPLVTYKRITNNKTRFQVVYKHLNFNMVIFTH